MTPEQENKKLKMVCEHLMNMNLYAMSQINNIPAMMEMDKRLQKAKQASRGAQAL
jgi:hypothetical protein